jgi:hypothetical protein
MTYLELVTKPREFYPRETHFYSLKVLARHKNTYFVIAY